MAASIKTQLLIIGGGPGGYVAAIRAGQLGLETVLVEEGPLGGCCLNVGCIPSKALIHAADELHRIGQMAGGSAIGITAPPPTLDLGQTVQWKDGIVHRLNQGVAGLLKKAKVRHVQGWAEMIDGKTAKVTGPEGRTDIRADYVILATGSESVPLPGLPFGGDILSSTEALSLAEVPSSLAVVGGGYIGLELGTAFAKLGAKVTIIEASDAVLPSYDSTLTAPVAKRLKSLGVVVRLQTMAKGFAEGRLTLERDGDVETLAADKVLVTVGRRPRTDGWGLEELGLAMDGPYIAVNSRCRTSMSGVYAIGDVTNRVNLTPVAIREGMAFVETAFKGNPTAVDHELIPSAVFTQPEMGTVGLSEEAAREREEVEIYCTSFRPMKTAFPGQPDRVLMKLVVSKANRTVLGCHIVAPDAGEMIQLAGIAIKMGATKEDFDRTVAVHPTMSEEIVTMKSPVRTA